MSEADIFAELAHELHTQESFIETLETLVEAAPALVGGDGAGVILAGARPRVGPDADTLSTKVDQLQLDVGEGPALMALAGRPTVLSHDLETDTRWPTWGPAAADLGVRSMMCVRLWVGRVTLGALAFYGYRRRAFDPDSLALAEIISRHASIALASARHEESLARAIDARKLVGQAQGILMERYGLDDRRAFDVLRRYSQQYNVKLTEVARLLVETRNLPEAGISNT